MSRKLFGLICAHQWELTAQSPITRTRDGKCVGVLYILRCKHCGDIKERKVHA